VAGTAPAEVGETDAGRACRWGYALLSTGWLLAHAMIGNGIWCPEQAPSCGPVYLAPRTTPYSDQRYLGELSVRGATSVSCAVVVRSGVRECLVGEATVQSHSPAVNSPPNAARMGRRDKRYAVRWVYRLE